MTTIFNFLVITLLLLAFPLYPQWVLQNVPGDIDVTLGIDFINTNQGVMSGWHINSGGQFIGNAFYTTDAGTNWFEATIPDSVRVIVGVQLFNENVAYGAGAYNLTPTGESKNIFVNHLNLNPRLEEYYKSLGMEFSGQEEYRGYFVETTDGGLSWQPKGSFEDSVYYLVGIHFHDLQTGFVLATGPANNTFAAILNTTDGGNSWNNVYGFEAYLFLNDIKFVDNLNGIAVGNFDDMTDSYGVVLKTINGGDNWIRTEFPQLLSLNSVTYLSISSILVAGVKTDGSAVVFRSDDGGNTWFECCTYNTLHNISGINSLPASGVTIVYGQYQPIGNAIPFIEGTIDNGATWHYSLLSQFPGYYLTKSKLVDESRWYLTGTQFAQFGFVLFTDNSGGVPVELVSFTAEFVENRVALSWITASELNNSGFEIERKSENEEWRTIGYVEGKGTTTEIQNYSFNDDLFEVNESKLCYRLKQIDFDGTFEYSNKVEVDINMASPEIFSLSQNYPNPFNPTTKIKFNIPQDGRRETINVTLIVYDVLGNEVATLVNEEKPAGEYEVEFSSQSGSDSSFRLVRNLSSGIYFYQLKSGNFIETKKMILIR